MKRQHSIHKDGGGMTVFCEGKFCKEFVMIRGKDWVQADEALRSAGWELMSKNGTWHRFCPEHAGTVDRRDL